MRKVFISKRTHKDGYVDFRILGGTKGKGRLLYTVTMSYDNPKAISDMIDKVYGEVIQKKYVVMGDNYLEEE